MGVRKLHVSDRRCQHQRQGYKGSSKRRVCSKHGGKGRERSSYSGRGSCTVSKHKQRCCKPQWLITGASSGSRHATGHEPDELWCPHSDAGQQHRADGSSSGIDPEAHCFLDSTLYQALRGESPRNDGDCDSSSSASGLSSVSGLSAEAECVFDSGLDEVAPPESSSESSPPAFQLEGMAARSERTAGGAQYPKASRGSTTTELPSSVPASGAAGRLTACSAGAACSAAGQPAVGQAVLPGLPVQAASVLPEASSARLLVRFHPDAEAS